MPMLPGFFDLTLLAALATVIAAGLLRGFAGFGSGMMMAPVFALLYGPVQTVAIVILLDIVVTAQLLPGVRRDVQWRFVLQMGFVAALFMPLGSWLLVTVDAASMSRAISLAVLAFVVILATGWRYHGERRAPVTALVGAISGTMMAATSLGMPAVMLYMLAGKGSGAAARANVTGYFAVTLAALVVIMLFSGLVSANALLTAAILLPAYMLAAWTGSRLFRGSSEVWYRRVALICLCCAGIIGLIG
ncbi:MAG: sulfite exporter TauE/SafE family protein [Alphaproteobacteria bacterium]